MRKPVIFASMLLLSVMSLYALTACGGKKAVQQAEEVPAMDATLKLPEIPSTLTTPEARLGYLMTHYWDNMPWTDAARCSDSAFVEQSMVDFLDLFSHADSALVADSYSTFLSVLPDSMNTWLVDMTCEYLFTPDSPVYNQEAFVAVTDALMKDNRLEDYKKEVLKVRKEEALKNRPGTSATDFSILLRDGSTSTLRKLLSRADATLLIFYDPDCEHCKQIIGQIAAVSFPAGIQVLAVDAEEDRDLWQQTAATLPAGWEVGFATTPILDRELYTLPASPTLYVISSEGTVIMKDANVDRALSYLAGSDQK